MESTDDKLWIGPSFKSHKQTEIIQSFCIRPQCTTSVCAWVSSPMGWNGSQHSGKSHSPRMSSMLSTANQPAEGASWHGPTNRASPHASHTHLCLSLSPGLLLQTLAFFLPEMATPPLLILCFPGPLSGKVLAQQPCADIWMLGVPGMVRGRCLAKAGCCILAQSSVPGSDR